jgi:hypothetical protein
MATVEETMIKVQRILTGPMNLQITLRQDTIGLRFADSSTAVLIHVKEWGKDAEGDARTVVLISSLILEGVKTSPELFEWVARNGGSRLFGHIEVYDDEEPGTVYLLMSHTLLGDYLDEKELESALMGVLFAADGWDEELQQRFGGKRQVDE